MAEDSLARMRRRRAWRRWLRKRLAVLIALVVVVVLVVGGTWALLFSSWLTARTVDVSGASTLSAGRIRTVADVPLGRPLARLDLAAIQARVESIGAVERAAISREWPHTVRIAITERTPVAVVDRGNGLQEVDSAGVLFGSPAHRPKGMPLIKADPSMDSDALAQAGQVAASLPADLAGRVNYLQLRSPDDIVLLLHDGRTVVWGSAADSTQKAEVADALLQRKVRQVDVSVPARPTTRG